MSAESIEQTQQLSAICVSCGMCCDGSLFQQAKLKDKQDKVLAESLHLNCGQNNNNSFFLLPCHHFNQQCTIYHRERPIICDSYFCEPLKQIKQNKMSLQQAQKMISDVCDLKSSFDIVRRDFPEFEGESIPLIYNRLVFSHLPENQQIIMRQKYAPLLLIGLKLFPLIHQMIGSRR